MSGKSRAPRTAQAAKIADQKPYSPTEADREIARAVMKRKAELGTAPRFKVDCRGSDIELEYDHPDQAIAAARMMATLATGDGVFADSIVSQAANAARSGKVLNSRELNQFLAIVHGIAPRDPTEAMLATQMAAVHNATMIAARHLKHVQTIAQQDSASNMLNKLARTFAGQVETLKRYRATGEQSIRVQHVHVSAGQAVVGISQGGGGTHESRNQSHAPSRADERGPALLGDEQALGMPMPGTGSDWQTRVPHARRKGGSTEG